MHNQALFFDQNFKNRHNGGMKLLNSPKETFAYGKKLAAKLKGGDILLLYGELGAGKTSLVKGLAAGFEIRHKITSPTFALMNVYDIKTLKHKSIKTFVHIDTYRLEYENELIEIGVEDYLGRPDTICAIEWPEKIPDLLKNKKTVSLALKHGEKPNERRVKIF